MEKIIKTKTKHHLHQCKNSEELLKALRSNNIDLNAIVHEYLKPETNASIIVTGSIAEGTGNSESDLDILVLLNSDSEFKASRNVINLEYGNSLEVLLYKNGIEINIDYMSRNRLNNLIESFLSIAPALYDPRDMESLLIIGWEDLQFLHRLKNGWVIENKEMAHLWQDEFMVDLLPIYSAVKDYFEGIELLEDAISALSGPRRSAIYMGRKCIEFGMFSLLAKNGFTSQSKKWIIHWCEKLKNDQAYPLLEKGCNLLFSQKIDTEKQEKEFIEEVIIFFKELRIELEKDSAIGKAIGYLRGEINYIDIGIA